MRTHSLTSIRMTSILHLTKNRTDKETEKKTFNRMHRYESFYIYKFVDLFNYVIWDVFTVTVKHTYFYDHKTMSSQYILAKKNKKKIIFCYDFTKYIDTGQPNWNMRTCVRLRSFDINHYISSREAFWHSA